MKRLLLFILLAFVPAFAGAQFSSNPIQRGTGAPGGSCPATRLYYDISAGALYTCVSGTWTAIGTFSGALGTNSLSFGSPADVFLRRDAAGALSLRNGATFQTFRVANTDDGAGNFERAAFTWGSNTFTITTEAGGTGSLRDMWLKSGGQLFLASGGTTRWTVNNSFVPLATNSYDIGTAAATARNIFVGTKVCYGTSGTVCDFFGTGTPEAVVSAAVGSTFRRTDGGAATSFYVKETGAGTNSGWVAK